VTKLLVRPAAAPDIEETHRWYERQRAGRGEEFLTAVDATLQELAAHLCATNMFPMRVTIPQWRKIGGIIRSMGDFL
jgi:hypothetical protein